MTDATKKYTLLAVYVLIAVIGITRAVDSSFYLAPSGLVISSTLVPWDESYSYSLAFAVAAGNSLAVGLIAIILSSLLGVLIGLVGVQRNKVVNWLYNFYVGAFRNVPVLFVILLFYFIGIALPKPAKAIDILGLVYLSNRGVAIPTVDFAANVEPLVAIVLSIVAVAALFIPVRKWLRFSIAAGAAVALSALAFDVTAPVRGKFGFTGGATVPIEFMVLTAALSIYYSVEIAEITRGSILSINKGVIDAAHALGLHAFDRFRFVVGPLALRFGLPSALNTHLVIIKATSLGVAIGYTELFSVSRLAMSSSGRILECLSLMGLYFLVICGSLSLVVNLVNDKLKYWNR